MVFSAWRTPDRMVYPRLVGSLHFFSISLYLIINPTALLTAGSMTDSAYEYMLKQWIMFGDVQAKKQCKTGPLPSSHILISFHADIKSANGIIENLVYVTPNRGLMYAGDINNKQFIPRYQHLTCYLPGLFIMGASVLRDELTPKEKEYHQWVAEGLAYTCYIGYRDQKTNLGPEISYMEKGTRWVDEVKRWNANGRVGSPPGLTEPAPEKDKSKRDYTNSDSKYMLRPEVRQTRSNSALTTYLSIPVIDCRKHLLYVEVHRRCQMAATWIRDLPSY